ncbi:MAG TPA: nuclear transport factor 2 family protein [Caulobacteraceae bacterium]
MTPRSIVAAVLLAGFATSPAAADALPPDLSAAVAAYDRAQANNDTDTLSRLVSDDFILVNSNASVEDKAQFLADFHLPGFKIEPYRFEDPVAKAWGDGAVTGGLLHLSWTQDGKHQTRALRIAYVWQKRDGRWRATYAQVTRVPD